jgi:hypothetical protein
VLYQLSYLAARADGSAANVSHPCPN